MPDAKTLKRWRQEQAAINNAEQKRRAELKKRPWLHSSKRKLPDYQPGPCVVTDQSGAARLAADPATDAFLQSYEWRRVRMEALKLYGNRCQCCGASPATGAVINVDHIKPRRLFPDLALTVSNLQVLCETCNHGKGNWDMTDWREASTAKA